MQNAINRGYCYLLEVCVYVLLGICLLFCISMSMITFLNSKYQNLIFRYLQNVSITMNIIWSLCYVVEITV